MDEKPRFVRPAEDEMESEVFMRRAGRRYEFENRFFGNPLLLGNYRLYQLGEYSSVVDYQSGIHPQEVMELSYFIEGAGSMIVDGVPYRGRAGDLFFVPRGGTHGVSSEPGSSFRMFYLGFEPHGSAADRPVYGETSRYFSDCGPMVVSDRFGMKQYIIAVLGEMFNRISGYTVMVEHLVEMIVLLAWRNFTMQNNRPYTPVYDDLYNMPTVYSIVRYIDQNIQDITDIRAIADRLGYSYSYLSHLFSSKTGIRLQDYISQRRLEYAQLLLLEKGAQVSQVAEKVGYQSSAAFTRAFRRVFGIPPSEYIRSALEQPFNQAPKRG